MAAARVAAPAAALAAVAAKVAAVKVVAREVVKVAVVKAVVKVAAREVEGAFDTPKKQQRRDAAFFVVQHICGAAWLIMSSLGVATDQQRSPAIAQRPAVVIHMEYC